MNDPVLTAAETLMADVDNFMADRPECRGPRRALKAIVIVEYMDSVGDRGMETFSSTDCEAWDFTRLMQVSLDTFTTQTQTDYLLAGENDEGDLV